MGKKDEKTNVMRLLDAANVTYTVHRYEQDPTKTGEEIAALLGENPAAVFKTLVTVGKSGKNYVFAVPVAQSLNLKKAASAAGEKYVEMIPQKALLPLTGYVHGGCSPLGMKKAFPTFFDKSVEAFDTVYFSAGKVGYQVELKTEDLKRVLPFTAADVCE